jgi:hypothetical protein
MEKSTGMRSARVWGWPNEAFDAPGTLRNLKRAARVRPFIDELIEYVRALASLRWRLVESGSP